MAAVMRQHAAIHLRLAGQVDQFFGADAIAVEFVAAAAQVDRVGEIAVLIRQDQVPIRIGGLLAVADAEFQLALRRLDRLLQHDIDGARDRLGTELRAGRADHLDALDTVRRQRLDIKARRHPFAIQQDLGIAAAKPAHADIAAAGADRHAWHALQRVADRGVAVALQLIATDDDLAGGIVFTRVIGFGRALDFDLLDGFLFLLLGHGLGGGEDGGCCECQANHCCKKYK